MSINALYELQKEMNRIGIAGVQVAVGNIKLKKIYEETEKTGEKIAVFKKISELIKKLMEDGETKDFYELSRLSNAILYTQGNTGKKGDLKEIKTTPLNYKTTATFRELNSLITALTTESYGRGRLEIITESYNNGTFKDLRIIQYLLDALVDSYSEIADFVYNKIIEVCDEAIVSVIKKSIDFEGKNQHARRLDIISSVAKGNEKEFYLEALEKGSKEVKVSAINALKDCSGTLDIILQYTNDKNKEVREAAYTVIGTIDSEKSTQALMKAFKSAREFNTCIKGVENSTSEEIAQFLIDEGNECLDQISKDDKETSSIDKICTILQCMENKKYGIIYEFVKNFLIRSCELKFHRLNYAIDIAGEILMSADREDLIQFLINLRNEKVSDTLGLIELSFKTALKYKAAEEVFDMYFTFFSKKSAPYYKHENLIKIIENSLRVEEWIFDKEDYKWIFDKEVCSNYKNVLKNIEIEDQKKWDKRWLNIFINLDEINLVCRFANKENSECVHYLIKKLDECLSNYDKKRFYLKEKGIDTSDIIVGLIKAEYKDVDDLIIHTFKKEIENLPIGRWNTMYYGKRVFCILNFLPKNRAKEVGDVLDKEIATLRGKNTSDDVIEYLEMELSKVKNLY